MSRRSGPSARMASASACGLPKVWPNRSRPQPQSKATFAAGGVAAGAPPSGSRPRPGRASGIPSPSDLVGLQPHLERRGLPKLRAAQRRDVLRRRGEEALQVLGPEQAALPRCSGGQDVAHQVQVGPLDVLQGRNREVALLAVDHLVRDDEARGVLEHALADRKSTRLNSSHANISYAVFCLKKKKIKITSITIRL